MSANPGVMFVQQFFDHLENSQLGPRAVNIGDRDRRPAIVLAGVIESLAEVPHPMDEVGARLLLKRNNDLACHMASRRNQPTRPPLLYPRWRARSPPVP